MQRATIHSMASVGLAPPAHRMSFGLAGLLSDLLVATLIVGFPVAFAIQGLVGLDENLFTVGARALTVALAVATLVVRTARIDWVTGRYLLALLGFSVIYGYAMVEKLIIEGQYSLAPPSVMFGLFFGIGIIPAVAILLSRLHYEGDPLRMRAILRLLLWLNTLFIAVALFNGRELLGTDFGRFKVEGGINQIYLGHMGVLNLYTVFFLATLQRARLSLITRGVMVAAAVLGLATIVLAGSRGPFVALYAAALYIFVSRIRRTSGIIVGIVAVSSMVAFIVLVDPYTFRDMTGSNLLIRIFEDDDFTDEARLTTYQIAWESFLMNPLLGDELLVFGTYPHNFILEILMATGVTGFLLFLMMYLPAWRECLAACFGGRLTFFHVFFVHMSVNFMFSGAVWGMHMLWTAIALVLVLNVIHSRRFVPSRAQRPARMAG